MSEKSFIEKIQLKASIKIFIILTILSVLFFTFWYIIKPEAYKKTFGIITVPKDGVLVPVDDSQCAKTIIRCENTNDCVQKCQNEQGDTSNYHCYKVPKDKEIYYLGTRLNEGESYCIPTDDANNGEDSVIASCGTYTGRLVRTLKQEDKKASLSWFCQCKYPTYFAGEKCLDPVACKYEYLDQDGRMQRSQGDLVEFGLDDKPVNIGATGTQYNVLTPDNITRDKYPTAKLSNGKPLFRCNCNDPVKTRGAISLPGDYLACYPDLCTSGRGSSGSTFDEEKKECVCGPQMYKSNISGFCYPLEVSKDVSAMGESFSNVCKPGENNICSCGIRFMLPVSDSSGNRQEIGILFKKDKDYYLSVIMKDNNIIDNFNEPGDTIFIKIDGETLMNVIISAGNDNLRWKQNLYNFVNITSAGNMSEDDCKKARMARKNRPICYIKFNMSLSEIYNKLKASYISNLLWPAVDLTNTKLNVYFESVKNMNYNSLTEPNKNKFKEALKKCLDNDSFTQESIFKMLNDPKYSKGKVPMKCNSFYYTRGDEYPTCNSWVGDETVGNNMLNPLGIACVNFCGLADHCNTKPTNNLAKCLLNPFVESGYKCECNVNQSGYYFNSKDGKDRCLPKLPDCAPCEEDYQCAGGNCTNCHVYRDPDGYLEYCVAGQRKGPHRCTSTNDLQRCSA